MSLDCLHECIDRPSCTKPAAPGWTRFWVINVDEVSGFTYERILRNDQGRVTGLSFPTGTTPTVRTLESEKRKEGAQFDSLKSDGAQLYTHTIQIVCNWRDSALRNQVESYNTPAEFIMIGQDRNGRYWIVDNLAEAFTLISDEIENGRLAADDSLRRITFEALSDSSPKEFLILDGTNPLADEAERLILTTEYLNGLVDCEDACECELSVDGVADPISATVTDAGGAGGTTTRNAEIVFETDTCDTADLSLVVLNNPNPSEISISNAVFTTGTPNTLAYDVVIAAGATPGNYEVELQVQGDLGCNASFVQNVEITL